MSFNADRFFREAIKLPTERDLQTKIGASEFSSPCDRCVAERLAATSNDSNYYWLAATIGTGVHMLMEENISTMHARDEWEYGQTWLECPLVIGELPNYGVIKSTPDCVLVEQRHLFDWKTTDRTKLKMYKQVIPTLNESTEGRTMLSSEVAARFTLIKYYGQTQSYARAAKLAGMPIENITIGFILREGKTDDDLWSWTFPYNDEWALTVWQRLCTIWSEVSKGKSPEDFSTSPGCYTHGG